jgi:hypothetical protein
MRTRCSIARVVSAPLVFFTLVALIGCPTEEPPPQNDDGCVDGWQDDFLGEVPAADGDLSCFAGTLASPAPPAACQTTIPLAGQTVDHQSSDPIGRSSVDVFYDNDATGAVDLSFTSNDDGVYTGDIPACQALAYRTERAEADEAPLTLQQHKVLSPEEQPIAYDFRSVSWATVNLITSPLFFGIEIEDGKGMLFGKAVGCDFEAIANVQVLVRDANCRVPEGSLVGYTAGELPAPGERATTTDGFYFVMNVPPGDYTLEMYRVTDGGNALIGSAPATVEPDGVSLVDVFIGRDDGQVMPDECLACE